MLPIITGEFGVVSDPEIRFSENKTSSAWIKIRGVAKDRVRDATGQWSDGDPVFIDIITGLGAENLFESIAKGDTIIVTGKLKQREYEKDGEKRISYEIRADSIGVSTRWNTARTPRALETMSKVDVEAVQAALGGELIDQSVAPF